MPRRAWWQIAKRVWTEIGRDNVPLISAGVAFYTFLSFVPLIASVVLIYGLAADPATIGQTVGMLFEIMPPDVASIISQQLHDMSVTAANTKGVALVLALATSLYGAMRASNSIIMALNVAYEVRETRSFFRLTFITFVFTLGFAFAGLVLITILSATAAAQAFLSDLSGLWLIVMRGCAWLATAALISFLVALTFRYSPNRPNPGWRWITPGSALTSVGGLVLTAGFSFYVVRFGSYNATYGALAAIIIFLLWLYLMAYLLCVGAELNAEIERQQAGEVRPLAGDD